MSLDYGVSACRGCEGFRESLYESRDGWLRQALRRRLKWMSSFMGWARASANADGRSKLGAYRYRLLR